MNIRVLYFISYSILLFLMSACDKSSEIQSTSNSLPETSEQASPHDEATSRILAAFKKDISVCSSAMEILKNDRAFIDEFSDALKRESKSLEDFLRQSSSSNTEEIQYILANLKFIFIDLDNHQTGMAVAWAGNTGVFCAPTPLRLEAIEALGESADAWEVRVNFLDRELADLTPTGSVSGNPEEEFEYFKESIKDASRIYSSTQRPKFLAWINKAISHVEAERKTLTTFPGMSIEEQNKIIDGKVAFLQSFIGK